MTLEKAIELKAAVGGHRMLKHRSARGAALPRRTRPCRW